MNVGGFDVREDEYAVLECPVCDCERKAYHLGSDTQGRVGWVCGVCTAELLEDPETGAVQRVMVEPDDAEDNDD